MDASTEQIAVWILTALKEEWEHDRSHLTCRAESVVLGPLKSKYNIEDADITRSIRYLVDRRMLQAVNRQDGRATLPSPAGLDYLAAHLANNTTQPSMPSNETYSLSVFISHGSKDEKLAEALVELLRNALNIPSDEIRCTSVNGYRLPAGAPTDEVLRREVRVSKTFIGLITPSSMESAYVMFELGARWGAGLHLVPLLGAGAGARYLRGPLGALNALKCSDAAQVHQLVDDVAKLLDIGERTPTAAYQAYVDRLIVASKPCEPATSGNSIKSEIGMAARPEVPELSERAKKLLLETEFCELSTPKGLSILRVTETEGDYLPHLYNAKPPTQVRCVDLNEVIQAVDDLVEGGWLKLHAIEGKVTEYRRTSRRILP
jgi:hypothetical protein